MPAPLFGLRLRGHRHFERSRLQSSPDSRPRETSGGMTPATAQFWREHAGVVPLVLPDLHGLVLGASLPTTPATRRQIHRTVRRGYAAFCRCRSFSVTVRDLLHLHEVVSRAAIRALSFRIEYALWRASASFETSAVLGGGSREAVANATLFERLSLSEAIPCCPSRSSGRRLPRRHSATVAAVGPPVAVRCDRR